jgi:hypothetical protein
MKYMTFAKAVFLAILFALTGTSGVYAADYYVDQANPASNDANAGTADQPWKTITKANQALKAGDTVHIKAGTYSSYIAPVNSGSASSHITYKNFGTDVVTISDAAYGILLDGKSYIVVQGLNFYNLDKFVYLQNNANRNTIASCNFDKARTVAWSGSKIYRNSSYNWIYNCRFSHYGAYTTEDTGTLLDIGNESVNTDYSSYNLIENNHMYHGGHHVLGLYGMYNVIRNNYFHNETWSNNHGNRVVYLNGHPGTSGRNLIEGNKIAYSGIPPDNYGGAGMSMATSYNIVRKNRFYHNDLAGVSMTTTSNYPSAPTYNKIYQNTFFHNGFNSSNQGSELKAAIGFGRYSGGSILKNAIKNNIFRSHPKSFGAYGVSLADQVIAGNWEDTGDPLFVNAGTALGDPMNSLLPDVNLQAGSPCVDRGVPLTSITSPSGSGTVFQVEDAGYFTNGWGVVEGDEIQLLGTTHRARITNVDYQTHTLTVNAGLTWSQNQGVSLAYEGTAPDVGAHEAGPAGSRPSAPQNLIISMSMVP